ncbi:hypothetical protein HDU92_007696 [Lobulomyces angularis]|nr:hypothetical protein HDU92_007696 [Lobulomyces angularis]
MRKLSSSSSSNLLKGIKSSDNFQNLKENSTNPLNSPSLNDKGRLSTFKLSNNLNPFSISQNCPPSPQKNTTNLKDEHVLTGVNEKSPSQGSLMTGEEKKYLESCQSASYTSLSSNEEDNSEFSSKSFSGSGVTVKEIKKFQKLFPFLYSEGEVLFQVYTCALDKDGLWHGKLYLTNCSFGFYGKIFKKVCTIVIKFSDLVTLEKKLTAGVFPNAIKITTNSRSLVFTSFLKRDCAFKDMNEKWKDCTSSLNKFQEISTTKTADVASFVIGVEDEEVVASNVISSSGKSLHALSNLENIKSFTKEGLNINTTMEVKLSEVEKDKRNSVSSSLNSSLGGENKSSAISSLSSSVGVSPIEISITDTEQNDLATSFKRKNTIKKGTGKSELLRKSKTDSLLDHDGINETGMQGNRAKSISPVMSPLTKLDSEIICPWEMQNVDPNGVENLKNNANITVLKNNMNLLEKFYCECESHLENEICLDQIFEMTVNELVECLFGSINTASGSKVFKEAALKSGFEDIKVGTWSLQLSKDSQREIYAFQTFKMPFLPKISTNWIERQKILRQSE